MEEKGITIETLADTVDLMISDNYVDRFKAEYYQLKIRIEKLKAMIEKHDAGTLEFEMQTPITVHKEQLRAMMDYMDMLKARSNFEHVEVE